MRVATTSRTNTPEAATKESSKFDEHLKCFQIVLENLDQCRKDESLIASRLLHPSSRDPARILELLWKIQRNESLVGLLARGFDRHQARTNSPTSASPLPSNLPKLTNETKLKRRVHLVKLSILWMQIHCLQTILNDLTKDHNHQVFQCHPSQQVLKHYFSLSASSYHCTTPSPYLSRLLTTPSCANAFVGAGEDFFKIWEALPDHLTIRPQARLATRVANFPHLSAQLDLLAQALNVSETYSDPLDLIKSCARALIRQTLDWTLDAYHNATNVARRASLFASRPSPLSNQAEPRVNPTIESELPTISRPTVQNNPTESQQTNHITQSPSQSVQTPNKSIVPSRDRSNSPINKNHRAQTPKSPDRSSPSVNQSHRAQTPKSPGEHPLLSHSKNQDATSNPVLFQPAPDCLATTDAGQVDGPATPQSSLQKTNDPRNQDLTPLSQTINGSLAPEDTQSILSVPATQGQLAPGHSDEVSSTNASPSTRPITDQDSSEKTNGPCDQGLSLPFQNLNSSPAPNKSHSTLPITEGRTAANDSVETLSSTDKHLGPRPETPQTCVGEESNLQPTPEPSRVPSQITGSLTHVVVTGADQKHLSPLLTRSLIFSLRQNHLECLHYLSEHPRLRVHRNLQHALLSKVRHSMGPLTDGSVANAEDPRDKPTNRKRRRSTDCGGQARQKRQHLDPIVEFENQKSSKKILKEFRDSPRLSSAFEQARSMALQNNSEANDDPDHESDHSSGSESTENSSVADDQDVELDPSIVEKLKANAAQFGKQETSIFARLMVLAAAGWKTIK
ncbi:hypothetical protein PtA15_5A417 [Puccinia triticina]|uniref:Uncharacterized protein n=1 Tax=Puccinia triticina TaxID=208348 RepID=A0ABY7CIA0_9BASI|nr:uncharacterized protein PtA15_5A417 [Puccinia triticina]WAQ84844.1 hypothetical protein PtA15_5A417 [Puccinia triticina]WAR58192.1 hypothetical protein PtB15_5B424 [Puccinia triticina]